jgi:DNA-binding GntR family transcriptional regulator
MKISTVEPPAALSKLKRTSLKQGIVDQIHAAILGGELKSGEQITELGLARRLGVSQPTVREALIELEHQGFIQRQSARRTFITALSERDISEMYQVRARLETLVVELLATSGMRNLEECDTAYRRMLIAARCHDAAEFCAADLEFHRALWRAAGNRTATEMLEQLVPRLFAFVIIRRAARKGGKLRSGAEEHGELLQLIRAGDREGACRRMDTSLRQARTEDAELTAASSRERPVK